MADVYIRFPVTCPVCGAESLTAFRAETVIDCLDSGTALRLSSTCHDASWLASLIEEEQIREYLFTTIGFTKSSEPWITASGTDESLVGADFGFNRERHPRPR